MTTFDTTTCNKVFDSLDVRNKTIIGFKEVQVRKLVVNNNTVWPTDMYTTGCGSFTDLEKHADGWMGNKFIFPFEMEELEVETVTDRVLSKCKTTHVPEYRTYYNQGRSETVLHVPEPDTRTGHKLKKLSVKKMIYWGPEKEVYYGSERYHLDHLKIDKVCIRLLSQISSLKVLHLTEPDDYDILNYMLSLTALILPFHPSISKLDTRNLTKLRKLTILPSKYQAKSLDLSHMSLDSLIIKGNVAIKQVTPHFHPFTECKYPAYITFDFISRN